MELDVVSLCRYVDLHVLQLNTANLTVKKFSRGQSNPTYLITTLTDKFVLRKAPPGQLLKSAHAVDREFIILKELYKIGSVPIPQPIHLCEDKQILGTPFYLMQYVDGKVYQNPNFDDVTPNERRQMFQEMAVVLAKLHSIDPSILNLNFRNVQNTQGQGQGQGRGQGQNLPKREYHNNVNSCTRQQQQQQQLIGYCTRQVKRWRTQYNSSINQMRKEPMKQILQLISFLDSKSIQIDSQSLQEQGQRLTHGDYKIDNIMFSKDTNKVVAILDWELATIGDPWCDVAYFCLQYRMPQGIGLPSIQKKGNFAQGEIGEDEFVKIYCEERGIRFPSPEQWAFYLCLSLFRLIGIVVGVQARAMQGNASGSQAAQIASDENIQLLANLALQIIQKAQNQIFPSTHSALITLPPKCRELLHKLQSFMQDKVFPNEQLIEEHSSSSQRWTIHPKMEELKLEAKKQGLWNLWVPEDMSKKLENLVKKQAGQYSEDEMDLLLGPRLKSTEYAILAECMGSCLFASELFNCSAPDTGNMEVLARYGSPAQQEQWLLPLLKGDIRSCFAMTEKNVASSDATNIRTKLTKVHNGYSVNGIKWWISGAMDPRCEISILLARNDWSDSQESARHLQHSMVLVPMKCTGVRIVRPMEVFGYDDAPHGHAEIEFDNVFIPRDNIILGEGRGFEVAQGRLGPGRIHHCMRAIGVGERAMSLMISRSQRRFAFGQPLHKLNSKLIGNCRIDLDMARLLVLEAAAAIDDKGAKEARLRIAEAKVRVPKLILGVIDVAIQLHGGEGVSQDTQLARLWAACRTLRLADGPDDVHLDSIGKIEVQQAKL